MEQAKRRSKAINTKSPDNEARANRILDAASKLIIQYGFDKTTVDDIAREAHVSKGAIYLHWPGKEDLFEALIWREVWDYVDEWLQAVMADPVGGTFVAMYKHSLLSLVQRPLMNALYTRDLRIIGDYILRHDPNFTTKRYLLGVEFMRMMQEANLLRKDIDPETVAYIFGCLSYGLSTRNNPLNSQSVPPIDKTLQTLSDMLTCYLHPDSSDSANGEAGKRLLKNIIEKSKQMF